MPDPDWNSDVEMCEAAKALERKRESERTELIAALESLLLIPPFCDDNAGVELARRHVKARELLQRIKGA